MDSGVDLIDLGMTGTEEVYFVTSKIEIKRVVLDF
jgi:hypothetical protein